MAATNKISILSNAKKSDLILQPYPHFVIKNALDPDVYQQLESQFPRSEIILNGRTMKDTWFDYPACAVTKDERVSPLWREFFAYHTSKEFFDELVNLAGDQIRALQPELERKVGRSLNNFVVGMRPGGRGDPLADGADVSTECQFYLNYTKQPRVVRGPHVDRPSELFAALLYFRSDDDSSTGADLEVCEAKSDIYPTPRTIKISKLPAEVANADVKTINTVRYEANTLVLFLNSAKSIHAVTPRSPTEIPRRHINFCCDVRFDLFKIQPTRRLALKRRLEGLPLVWRLANLI